MSKAEGAAQGYTVLGAIVLILIAINMISAGLNGAINGNFEDVITIVLGIALVVMAILSLDACGFVNWKVGRSGLLLAIFGLISIIIVARGLSFNILSWLMNAGTLAGFMILLAGIIIMVKH